MNQNLAQETAFDQTVQKQVRLFLQKKYKVRFGAMLEVLKDFKHTAMDSFLKSSDSNPFNTRIKVVSEAVELMSDRKYGLNKLADACTCPLIDTKLFLLYLGH
jgi:hypothetical protein